VYEKTTTYQLLNGNIRFQSRLDRAAERSMRPITGNKEGESPTLITDKGWSKGSVFGGKQIAER
jgi:hypothetical protein